MRQYYHRDQEEERTLLYSHLTTIKKAFRPEPERRNLDEGKDSEGDVAFRLGSA